MTAPVRSSHRMAPRPTPEAPEAPRPRRAPGGPVGDREVTWPAGFFRAGWPGIPRGLIGGPARWPGPSMGPKPGGPPVQDRDCPEHPPRWTLARRLFFPSVFLAVLVQTAAGVSRVSSGAGVVAGDAILIVFAAAYVYSLVAFWNGQLGLFWLLYAVLVALWLAELPFAHGDAFVMCIYIAVLSIARFRARAVPLVAAIIAVSMFLPAAFPSWHEGVDTSALLSIGLVSVAMYSFFALVRANQALVEARTEVARLAAENERTRIARDLHDLLGHSLTTITVKAGLARRLAATDPVRSAAEIAEVEELSRRTLNDVRAVVTHYRDVSLAGELAAGRELLRAAGIDAQLPTATDVVAPEHQALFAWVVREGLTNVVRHAHATTCAVTFGSHSLDVVDNGVGGDVHPGNGLGGLRERVESAGGTLEAGPESPSGWRVHVEVPAPAPA